MKISGSLATVLFDQKVSFGLPSRIICKMTPAAFLAIFWPTMPCDTCLGSKESSKPSPLMWECAPILSMRVIERTSCTCAAAID